MPPQPLQLKNQNREFIIEWNFRFPADKWWREKYGVALFSEAHLNISQLSIANEYHEMLLFEEFESRAHDLEIKRKDYENGIWISKKEPESVKDIDALFNRIDVGSINNNNSQLQIEE